VNLPIKKFLERFVRDQSFFHIGEPIEIEISYSTQSGKNISEVGLHPVRGLRA